MRLDSAYTALKLTHDRYVLNQVKNTWDSNCQNYFIFEKGCPQKIEGSEFLDNIRTVA